MKYCPTSTVFRNAASIQILPNLSCCDNFSIRSLFSLQWQFFMCRIIIPTSLPVLSWQDSYSSHISATATKRLSWFTGIILRKQFQSSQSRRNNVSTNFSHLYFTALLWTMDSWFGRLGVRFRRILNIINSSILSHSPCGLSSLLEHHFFSDPGPRNDHCPAPNLFLVVFRSPWDVVEHRHEDDPSSKFLWCYAQSWQ